MFPKGVHDDTLDSLAYQLQIAEAPAGYDLERRIQEAQEQRKEIKSEVGL